MKTNGDRHQYGLGSHGKTGCPHPAIGPSAKGEELAFGHWNEKEREKAYGGKHGKKDIERVGTMAEMGNQGIDQAKAGCCGEGKTESHKGWLGPLGWPSDQGDCYSREDGGGPGGGSERSRGQIQDKKEKGDEYRFGAHHRSDHGCIARTQGDKATGLGGEKKDSDHYTGFQVFHSQRCFREHGVGDKEERHYPVRVDERTESPRPKLKSPLGKQSAYGIDEARREGKEVRREIVWQVEFPGEL